MFKKINKQVEIFLKEKKITKKELNLREKAEEAWEDSVTKKTQKNTQVLKFSNKTLLIKAKTPSWKMEIEMQKEAVKKKLTKNTQVC